MGRNDNEVDCTPTPRRQSLLVFTWVKDPCRFSTINLVAYFCHLCLFDLELMEVILMDIDMDMCLNPQGKGGGHGQQGMGTLVVGHGHDG